MLQYSKEAEEIWDQFVALGKQSLHYKRKAQELIPKLATSKIYLKHGFSTLEHAASQLAGIGEETVRKILDAHRRTQDLPELRKAMSKVGYSKVTTVLAVKDTVSEQELVEMVKDLPTEALRKQVSEIKNFKQDGQYSLFDEAISEDLDGSGYQKSPRFSSEVTNELQQSLNLIKHKLEKEKGHPITNQELLEYFVSKEKLPEKNNTEYPRSKTNRTLTPKHKEYVKSQNNYICQHPNCNQVATEIHHQNYQALNPLPTNLKAFCKVHHQLAHYETKNKTLEQIQIDKKVQKYWLRT
jgi:hypothetical protein